MSGLNHFDEKGNAVMVDVSEKSETKRVAVAKGSIKVSKEIMNLIKTGNIKKGDVLGVSRVAGIMASKQTSNLIPMCHPLMINGTNIDFELDEENSRVIIYGSVKTTGKTGVEMEALTAVSVAALTIYDMCKAVDKRMVIETNSTIFFRRRGSPPVNLIFFNPISPNISIKYFISSSVNPLSFLKQTSPSGIQYTHLKLHASVREILK